MLRTALQLKSQYKLQPSMPNPEEKRTGSFIHCKTKKEEMSALGENTPMQCDMQVDIL